MQGKEERAEVRKLATGVYLESSRNQKMFEEKGPWRMLCCGSGGDEEGMKAQGD